MSSPDHSCRHRRWSAQFTHLSSKRPGEQVCPTKSFAGAGASAGPPSSPYKPLQRRCPIPPRSRRRDAAPRSAVFGPPHVPVRARLPAGRAAPPKGRTRSFRLHGHRSARPGLQVPRQRCRPVGGHSARFRVRGCGHHRPYPRTGEQSRPAGSRSCPRCPCGSANHIRTCAPSWLARRVAVPERKRLSCHAVPPKSRESANLCYGYGIRADGVPRAQRPLPH